MSMLLIPLPGNEALAESIATEMSVDIGEITIRSFPDEETYVRIHSDVKGKKLLLICTLHKPNDSFLPLYFLSRAAKEMGASSLSLVAPYLGYMRQDKRFQPGEGITSTYFADLINSFADMLVTVDPHLHRRQTLSEIYTIPNRVIHASEAISSWIAMNVRKPLLIGPDSESKQWVSEIGRKAKAPYVILEKQREGDREVKVSLPSVDLYRDHTPVLVDDIISTAHTMIETIDHLRELEMRAPVCIGVHAIFAPGAYQELKEAGAEQIITCNTIAHPSNGIDVTKWLVEGIRSLSDDRLAR